MEAVEAAGLWLGRRWAEYLTFIATTIFVPYEVYELTKGISVLKVVTLTLNVAIAAYLLLAKRLFGLRGGGKAARAEYDADAGWAPIERATPAPATPGPAARRDNSAGDGQRTNPFGINVNPRPGRTPSPAGGRASHPGRPAGTMWGGG